MGATTTTLISTAAAKRGITRIVHFTPLENVIGIVETGALLPRQTLARYAATKGDAALLDYLRINDQLRLDKRLDCLNLSIEHPNTFLFSRFRQRHTQCYLWVVLYLPLAVLDTPGALFTTDNAAGNKVRLMGTASGLDGFNALFAADAVTNGDHGRKRQADLAPRFPTNVQAEVLLPAALPYERITALAVENEEHAHMLKGMLRVKEAERLCGRVVVDPLVFGNERSA